MNMARTAPTFISESALPAKTVQREFEQCSGGPRGERRLADVIRNAVRVMRIATGMIDAREEAPKPRGPYMTTAKCAALEARNSY